MVSDAQTQERLQEREALRGQEGTHMTVEAAPDARGMGAESAEYVTPDLDPQWIPAWKMFVDEDGEYGVAVRLPRGQWSQGGRNALENMRRPDGGFWFRIARPDRIQEEGTFECFIGQCQKKLHKRIQVVTHIRGFHEESAKVHRVILERMEQQIAQDDPRLQRLLDSMAINPASDPIPDEPKAGVDHCQACGGEIVDGNWGDHQCEV